MIAVVEHGEALAHKMAAWNERRLSELLKRKGSTCLTGVDEANHASDL